MENSIDEDRFFQLNLFFTNRLLNSLIINSSDLPEFKFFSKKLQNKTFKIRQMPVVKKGVNFIIAPPGYGKSHFVNELGISDSHVYRFWVCNEDEDGAKRLQFDNFIAQMSAQLFQDKRKRTQNEIIEKMSETNCIYAIDGLDHVFNYARNQFLNFLNFISKASLKSNICLLVLTREIPGHTFDDYNKIVLKKWSRKETYSYLQNFSISNYKIYDQTYSISVGYPLVTYLLAQDYLRNGFISNTNVIKDVDDYYREILSIEDHNNAIFSLGLISILHPFIHKQDFVYFKQELALQNLISAARKYPYLIHMERGRFYFYHDSLYSYVRDEFFKSDSNKKSLDDIYDKIYASLLNGETQFMGRFSLSYFDEECNKTIIKKYCNLNFFQKIAINTFDFESLQEIYKKIIVSLKLKDARYLSIYETYNLLTILLILNRNFYSDNVDLSVQLFNYFKNNNIIWENLIFSSGRLYKNLCVLSTYNLTNKSDELYNPEPMQSLFEDAKNELSFFNVLTSDFSIKLLPYLENAKYIDSNSFCEFIVSNYIHGNDGGNSKNFVNAYLTRPRQYLKCEAVKAFSFVNHSTDMFPISYGCNKAVIRLQQLGIIDGVGNYKTLSSLLTDIKKYNSYQVSDYVNGYIRYATKYNRQIELNQLSDKNYVWFKNNCPLNGPLYDDFRFADLEDGEVQFTIQIDCCWNNHKYAVFGRRTKGGEFSQEPLFECDSVRELVKWFNTPWED